MHTHTPPHVWPDSNRVEYWYQSMNKTPFQASAPCIKLSAQYAVPLPFHANDIAHQTQELQVPSQKLQRAKRQHNKNMNNNNDSPLGTLYPAHTSPLCTCAPLLHRA